MHRKQILILLAACCAASSVALAGEVFGKVVDAAGAVAEGAEITVACGEKSYPPVKTDKTGAFHLVTAEAGKCTVTVKRGAESASLKIAAYDEPVQCDIVLETKDGKLAARRK